MIEYTVVEQGGNASAFPFEILLILVPLAFMALLFKDLMIYKAEQEEVEAEEADTSREM